MKYVSVAEARNKTGVRVALTMGNFAPWGQAVKKMLEYKGIDYVPVGQAVGETNDDLVKWTGARNAPVVVWDDKPPAVRWLDQIVLIENIKAAPPLLPRDSVSRARVIGIVSEIAGEWGFGWCRRVMMFDAIGADAAKDPGINTMLKSYGTKSEAMSARDRVVDIIGMLIGQLKAQQNKGSPFFVGQSVTAADIYWACFSSLLDPIPDACCEVPKEMQESRPMNHPAFLATQDQAIQAVNDPILAAHRDNMFAKYLKPCAF